MAGKREIVGLYLGENQVEMCRLEGRWGRWAPVSGPWPEPDAGRPQAEQVREILGAVRPSRRRALCLALPRSALVMREVALPQLEPEEAASAVRLGIGLHAHLDPGQIYHDEWAFRRQGRTVVLVAYTPRSSLDPILRVIRETGHHGSLRAISPATLGLDGLLRRAASSVLPCTALSRQGDGWVLSLHGPRGWEGSHPVPVNASTGLPDALSKLAPFLPAPFDGLATNPQYLIDDAVEGIGIDVRPEEPCSALKDLGPLCQPEKGLSLGLCAAALGLMAFPALSLEEAPRRRPLRLRLRPYQLVAGGTLAALLLVTGALGLHVLRGSSHLAEQRQEISGLEERLRPLLATQEETDHLAKRLKDLDAFRKDAPSTLAALKVLTELTPSDTWIKSLSLKDQTVRLTAEGGSAVEAMGKWRQTPLFSEVKLVSPVTKDRRQIERFSVEIQIKDTVERGKGHGN